MTTTNFPSTPENRPLCDYIKTTIGGRWLEAEPFLIQHPYWAYTYALKIMASRWPEAESIIIQHPHWAYAYAKFVIKGPWPEAELILSPIMTDPEQARRYSIKFGTLINQK